MLLRIYYVKDFPLHTLLLEIRKDYFMEPENKFATAEEKDEEEEGGGGEEIDRTLQHQVVSKQRGRDLKGAGRIFLKKMIASCFSFFLSFSFFLPSLCFKSVLGLSSESV